MSVAPNGELARINVINSSRDSFRDPIRLARATHLIGLASVISGLMIGTVLFSIVAIVLLARSGAEEMTAACILAIQLSMTLPWSTLLIKRGWQWRSANTASDCLRAFGVALVTGGTSMIALPTVSVVSAFTEFSSRRIAQIMTDDARRTGSRPAYSVFDYIVRGWTLSSSYSKLSRHILYVSFSATIFFLMMRWSLPSENSSRANDCFLAVNWSFYLLVQLILMVGYWNQAPWKPDIAVFIGAFFLGLNAAIACSWLAIVTYLEAPVSSRHQYVNAVLIGMLAMVLCAAIFPCLKYVFLGNRIKLSASHSTLEMDRELANLYDFRVLWKAVLVAVVCIVFGLIPKHSIATVIVSLAICCLIAYAVFEVIRCMVAVRTPTIKTARMIECWPRWSILTLTFGCIMLVVRIAPVFSVLPEWLWDTATMAWALAAPAATIYITGLYLSTRPLALSNRGVAGLGIVCASGSEYLVLNSFSLHRSIDGGSTLALIAISTVLPLWLTWNCKRRGRQLLETHPDVLEIHRHILADLPAICHDADMRRRLQWIQNFDGRNLDDDLLCLQGAGLLVQINIGGNIWWRVTSDGLCVISACKPIRIVDQRLYT